jgi:hypothetical protein
LSIGLVVGTVCGEIGISMDGSVVDATNGYMEKEEGDKMVELDY